MSLIAIAESDPIASQRLLSATSPSGHEVRLVDDLELALELCENHKPQVLVIGPSFVGELAFELASFLRSQGLTSTVFAAAQVDAPTLRSALRAGAADVVSITDDLSEIGAAVDRAVESVRVVGMPATAGKDAEAAGGKVVTVFSTKGGVGKTVLSTNLGVALAKAGKNVVIVDLDLDFGDVAIMLGMKPTKTIYDAMQQFDRLDETLLEGLLETHSSGAKVLLAPVRPEDAECISASRIAHVINMLRSMFEYVVVDTSPSFSEPVLAAIDKSDQVYVITMMDVASIKNTRISLQKLSQLGYDERRIRLVLNRADSKVLLELPEVEKAITGPVVAHIPSDRIVPRSVNKGVPVVLEAPRSGVARAILSLAKQVQSDNEKEAADVA